MPRYNKELSTQPKLQSGLGREMVSVYGDGDDVNNLKFAKVIKINYLYNTVDVRAVYKGERFIKSEETDGRYSARLPVTFGGMTSANGFAYGETIPISLGDLVLIGFSEGNLKSAVVVNIYKNDVTANELAPIDVSSGDPESSKLFNAVMEKMTLYPSQTYEVTKGDGNVEHTYAGGTFFATKTNATANARMNDTLYDYTSLPRKRLRGRTVYPNNISTPQILFTQQSLFGTEFTRVFFDDDNSLRFSRTSKSNTQRADIQLANTTTAKFRVQMDSIIPNDLESKKYIEFGIVDGVPIMSTADHNIYLSEKGFMIDDKPFDDYVNALVDTLGIRVNDLDKVVMGIKAITGQIDIKLLAEIIGIVQQLNTVAVPKLKKDLSDLTDRVNTLKFDFDNLVSQYDAFKKAQDEYNKHTTDGLGALNQEIVDARGGFGKLVLRLNSEKQKNDTFHNEVTDARTAISGNVYKSLKERLDKENNEFPFEEILPGTAIQSAFIKPLADIKGRIDTTKFNIGMLTDMHWQPNNTSYSTSSLSWRHADNMLSLQDKLDVIYGGGDNNHSWSASLTHIESEIRQVSAKILFTGSKADRFMTLGNHDDGSLRHNLLGRPLKPVDIVSEDFFKEAYHTKQKIFGEVRNGDSIYFYKDYPDKKIRFISIDTLDIPANLTNADGSIKYDRQHIFSISQAQFSWLATVAFQNVPADYHTCVFTHVQADPTPVNYADATEKHINFQLLINLIDAFKAGTSVTLVGAEPDFPVNLVANFTQQKARTFIGYFNGHTHSEKVKKEGTFMDYHLLNSIASGSNRSLHVGEILEDAWTIVSIDTAGRKINMLGFGSATASRSYTY